MLPTNLQARACRDVATRRRFCTRISKPHSLRRRDSRRVRRTLNAAATSRAGSAAKAVHASPGAASRRHDSQAAWSRPICCCVAGRHSRTAGEALSTASHA